MRKSLVSIVALGLFAGAPVIAQTTTDEATTNQTPSQAQQQTQQTQQQDSQQATQQQRAPSAEQMQQMLSAFEEQSEIDGFIARAIDAEGNPVLVLVTAPNSEPDRDVQAQESDVRDRLEQSRFNGVEMLQQPTIVRAIVDENNQIIALAATRLVPTSTQTSGVTDQTGTQDQAAMNQGQSGTEGQTGSQAQTATSQGQGAETSELATSGAVTGGEPRTMTSEDDSATGQSDTETGQAGRALSEPGTARIISDLEQAGIENPAEFQGQIVRARTSDGAPVFFMVSSQDMQAGGADGINQDEIRKNLEQADLQDIQFIGDAKLLRGDMEGDQVFVLAGSDLMGNAQQSGQQQ